MDASINTLVTDFEAGRISRRQLIARLAALMVGLGGLHAALAEEGTASTFKATALNHVALRVTDVKRSRDFYQKHLGLEIMSDGEDRCFLKCGDEFVALFRGDEPKLDHYCYSIDDYDVSAAEEKLKAAGLKPEVHGGRIYFPDPDGMKVQLAASRRKA